MKSSTVLCFFQYRSGYDIEYQSRCIIHVMFRKFITYAFIVCIAYIIVIGYLGFVIRDDFLALTFPSWPLLINCFEGCGYKMVIALFANGILVGLIALMFMGIVSFSLRFIRKLNRSFVDRKETRKT